MAYIKLNEVTLVESAIEPNLLIEEGGEIKRIPTSNVVTAGGSSGGKVITYIYSSGLRLADGTSVSKQDVLDEWNAGSVLRFAISDNESSNVFNVSYTMNSGGLSELTIRYLNNTGEIQSKSV